MKKIESLKKKAYNDTMRRIKRISPRVFKLLTSPHKKIRQLGAVSWDTLGTDLINDLSTLYQYKEISKQEKDAAQQELLRLQEVNKSLEKQKQLDLQIQEAVNTGLTIQQKYEIAKNSIFDQLKAKPWAIPALGALFFYYMKNKGKRR